MARNFLELVAKIPQEDRAETEAMTQKMLAERGSGNVFADLGLPSTNSRHFVAIPSVKQLRMSNVQ